MDSRVPDIVVAVDFGTTYTGVGWRRCKWPKGGGPIQIIKSWPFGEDEIKVPSQILYHPDDQTRVLSWGFGCAQDRLAGNLPWQFFKLFVDPKELKIFKAAGITLRLPESQAEALGIVTDYLHCLYEHIKQVIMNGINREYHHDGRGPGWNELRIHFLFSIPTTWQNPKVAHDFKQCYFNAGFAGPNCFNHTAEIYMTESEAAAIDVLKNKTIGFDVGDLFLCVDAGGGTTDFSLTEVTSNDAESPQMRAIFPVRGVGHGASRVDIAFSNLVRSRIDNARGTLPELPWRAPRFSTALSASRAFKIVKHGFGSPARQQPHIVRVDEVGRSVDVPELQIRNGNMQFSDNDMAGLFDPTIDRIATGVTRQLDQLTKNHDRRIVKYVILSGGLGKSEYVRSQMRHILAGRRHEKLQSSNAVILNSEDPQLVVVRGMLFGHQQTMAGIPVLRNFVARASYGIVVQEEYDKHKHLTLPKSDIEIIDKKKWAKNQIKWLFTKGDHLDANGENKKHGFQIKLRKGNDCTVTWSAEVVMWDGDGIPPNHMAVGSRVRKICDLVGDTTILEEAGKVIETRVRSRWYKIRKDAVSRVCRFDVAVKVGPADLGFELQVDGQRISKNHEPITAEWTTE
ncbi:hypothetical protein MCOR10_008619 [Pyricularia oryzae]|nr:hypothetical protein MCOR10_008619 [Pyricularia oryzae]KAI6533336.1 hypothetical protein MCOR05_006773 [Pyricularia oryzae]